PVQLGNGVGTFLQQASVEDVGEELVVAIPAALVVQGYDEQVAPFQGYQCRCPTGLAGDGVAQGAGEPVQDRGVEQEVVDLWRLLGQDLLDEVVDDVTVVAGEPRNERSGVRPVPKGQSGQLERGDPPLGALAEHADVAGGQRESGR